MENKYILLTNDDGMSSKYTRALSVNLKYYYNVFQFLPYKNFSGASGSISNVDNLTIKEENSEVYLIDGTPVECANCAIQITDDLNLGKSCLAISGPNFGLNYGKTVFYSGTFMAANEFYQDSIKSIAISLEGQFDGSFFYWLAVVMKKIEEDNELTGLLNINIKINKGEKEKIMVISESEIVDSEFSYFEIKKNNYNYALCRSESKRIIDEKSFISVCYYFDSNSKFKEKRLIKLIKEAVGGNEFWF